MTRPILLIFLLASTFSSAYAGILQRGNVQLICHRTANRDMPENTLEALAYAARVRGVPCEVFMPREAARSAGLSVGVVLLMKCLSGGSLRPQYCERYARPRNRPLAAARGGPVLTLR